MAYAPHTSQDVATMLRRLGLSSVDELFTSIPSELRLEEGLPLPEGVSEAELRRRLGGMARRNRSTGELVCFAGAGSYEHDVPAAVSFLASRSEFATAYTPYQAEVSQGTLQAIFEYQSYICRLTGLDVSNASLYDGATALVEAVLMAVAQTRRRKILVPRALLSSWRTVLDTYLQARGLELVELPAGEDGRLDPVALDDHLDEETACLVLVQPNAFGVLEDAAAIGERVAATKALLVAVVNPITLPLVLEPAAYGASIAVGEGQPLGLPLSFGGPRLGFMAVRDALKRRMPGRLVGETVDRDGRRGFVLTLQTREQHIRREKATSNICSNQGLAATMATIHLSLLGKKGLSEVSRACLSRAHYLAERLSGIEGFELPLSGPFFHEFVLRTPVSARDFLAAMAGEDILAGVALADAVTGADERDVLVAVTELRTREEMDRYVEGARGAVAALSTEARS